MLTPPDPRMAGILQRMESQLRQELPELIDELFLAFKASGRPDDEYLIVQWYEHKLFAAVNAPELTLAFRVGGLKLIRLYIKACIQGYLDEARRSARNLARTDHE